MSRIIHATTVHPTYDNRIYFKECVSLKEAGHDVHLLNANGDTGASDCGVVLHSVARRRGRLSRFLVCLPQALVFLLRFKADLYHIHDPELMPVGFVLRLCGRKVVFDMHENLPKSVRTKPWIPASLRPLISRMVEVAERFFLIGTSVVFAEASYAKDFAYLRRTATVQNFPRLTLLDKAKRPADRFSGFVVGYIGGVTRLRGLAETLQAIVILVERGLDVRFECIGPVESALAPVFADYKAKLGDRLSVRGYMRPSEGLEVIARCHVGVAVLQPIPNYFESFPTKMFEYFGLGLPVVVSNFPLYREVVVGSDCGLAVKPMDPEALAEALATLYGNPGLRERMGANGRRSIQERYCWEREFTKLLKLYDGLLERCA